MIRYTQLSVIILFLTAGCAATVLEYSPQIIADGDPKQIIKQVIMEQPLKKAPRSAFVNDQYMEIEASVIRAGDLSARKAPTTISIYFNNIRSMSLTKSNNYYIVALFNKAGEERYRVYSRQEEQARLFIDAIYSMTNFP